MTGYLWEPKYGIQQILAQYQVRFNWGSSSTSVFPKSSNLVSYKYIFSVWTNFIDKRRQQIHIIFPKLSQQVFTCKTAFFFNSKGLPKVIYFTSSVHFNLLYIIKNHKKDFVSNKIFHLYIMWYICIIFCRGLLKLWLCQYVCSFAKRTQVCLQGRVYTGRKQQSVCQWYQKLVFAKLVIISTINKFKIKIL